MASNQLPNGQGVRLRLAKSELGGIRDFGVQIGLSVVTYPVMDGKIQAFEGADSLVGGALKIKSDAQSALNGATDAAVALAGVVKRFLTDLPGFGTQPNAQWQELGFAAGSLAIERKTIEVLVGKIGRFLQAHTQYENTERGVTGANCEAKVAALLAARNALENAKADYAAKKGVEDEAFQALGATMSNLVKELKLHLSGDDALWYAFGLRRPSDPETPAPPHNLQLSPAGTGRIFADWDDVPGAQRYHLWLAQGEQKAVRFATLEDSEAMLSDLIVGSSIEVYIVAVNEGGDSVPSQTAKIAVA